MDSFKFFRHYRSSLFIYFIIIICLVIIIPLVQYQQIFRSKAQSTFCPEELVIDPVKKIGDQKVQENKIKLASITHNLSQSAKKYRKAALWDKGKYRREMLDLAKKRKTYLLDSAEASPEAALTSIFPTSEGRLIGMTLDESCVEQEVELSGELSIEVIDYPDGTAKYLYTLKTKDEKKRRIHIAGIQSERLRSNQLVKIRGYLMGDALLTSTNTASNISIIQDYSGIRLNAAGQRSVLGVVASFKNTPAKVGVPLVNDFIFNKMNVLYKELSYDRMSLAGNTIGTIQLTINETCSPDVIILAVMNAIDKQVDFRQYQHLIISIPFSLCNPLLGISSLGPHNFKTNDGAVSITTSINNEAYTGNLIVMGHEFGHSLGLEHSSFMNCGASAFASYCQVSEYGDYYDIMGNKQAWHYNAAKKEKLGWLDASNILIVATDGIFTIEPIETASTGLKLLKIPRGNNKYLYIHYRQPFGADSNSINPDVYNGALVHIDNHLAGNGGGIDTELLDASPPGDIKTPVLHIGESLKDPNSGISIKVVGKSAEGLTVLISGMGGVSTPSPTIPLPTLSIVPENVILTLNFALHGIGSAGDKVNPGGGNKNPLRKTREVRVDLYNSMNLLTVSKTTTLAFDEAKGIFIGSIDLGKIPSGAYLIKVTVKQYLAKYFPGIIMLNAGDYKQLPTLTLITGDIIADNVLNLSDYMVLSDCFADFSAPKNCSDTVKRDSADLTDDGRVDQFDYNLFLREISIQSGD